MESKRILFCYHKRSLLTFFIRKQEHRIIVHGLKQVPLHIQTMYITFNSGVNEVQNKSFYVQLPGYKTYFKKNKRFSLFSHHCSTTKKSTTIKEKFKQLQLKSKRRYHQLSLTFILGFFLIFLDCALIDLTTKEECLPSSCGLHCICIPEEISYKLV